MLASNNQHQNPTATNPTETGGHIAITAAPSSSLFTWVRARFGSRFRTTHMESHSISRIMVFFLSMHRVVFMGALTKLRTQMTTENQSAFEINENGAFMITALVALFVVEVSSGILFFTNIPSKYYTIFKFLGIFSASVAPYFVLTVLEISPKLSWMLHLLGYGITIAYVCCSGTSDDDVDKVLDNTSPISVFTYCGLILVPLALLLVLFVPRHLDWIVYSVIWPIFGMEFICFFVIFFKFMCMFNEEKPKAQAHQDKNNNKQ